MRAEAYHGLAGALVRLLVPATEADPAGVLLSFLAAFGAAVGPGPHAKADGARHPAKLDVVLVGRSARARKGTAWSIVRRVLEHADPAFIQDRVVSGLASGEGLVADLAKRPEGVGRSVLVLEAEFARLLRVAARSATLSALVRECWDGGRLAILTRKEPLRVDGASVAIVGHCTAEELRRRLDATEIANGLGNRFLFSWVERSKRLPSGGDLPEDDLEVLGVRVGTAIARARELDELVRTPQADARWADIYNAIDDDLDGVVGSLTARAEAQLLRLSVVYAMLDGSPVIELAHLDAAEAVWEHCAQTISRVFTCTEPDRVTPRLLAALEGAGAEGLDGSQQRDLFSRHLQGAALAGARAELERRGLAYTTAEDTGGRPRIVTRLVEYAPVEGTSGHLGSLSSLLPSLEAAEVAR